MNSRQAQGKQGAFPDIMNQSSKTAIVFGATGLVGHHLVDVLLSEPIYGKIVVVNRNRREYADPRISQVISDLSDPSELAPGLIGDELFICLGTTIRKAGSVAEMERIDRDLPIRLAGIAAENGVKGVAVVSSIGANPRSRNYYLRIKGQMEEGILALPFKQAILLRPSMLLGTRNEFRLGEWFGKVMMRALGFLMIGKFRRYRAVEAARVARMMVRALASREGKVVIESDEINA